MEQRSSKCSLLERGQLRLSIKICQENLTAFVYEARHLKHPKLNAGPCSIFVKFSVISKDDSSIICQTKEVVGNVSPMFNEVLTYQISPGDSKKRLWITVWCKDGSNEQTDLIGCMSFGMEHLQAKTQKKAVEGWFYLLSESVGRRKHIRAPMSNAYVSDGNKGGQLPFDDVQVHSMMPLKIVMHRHPTGFGFTIKGSSPVCVVKVKPYSFAAMAGLAPGDYIESVNGQNVSRLSAESVAAIITSIEKILILDIYRQNCCPKQCPAFEQDENHPVHKRNTLLWNQRAKKTSSEYVDADSRRIKRRRVDLMRTFRSQVKSTVELDYNIFVRKEYQVEEAIYAEIDESLPMAPHFCSQRDDIMSSESEKCLAPSSLSDSGVSSAVSNELDRGFLVPRHELRWSPSMSAISRTLAVFSPLRGIVSDSDCSFAGVANGDCVTSNSNEMSDRLDNKAFLSDTATLIDERISSTQMTRLCTPSSKPCDIALHRLLSREESFAGNVLSGVQMFSWPLRHYILSRHQHSTLFQNIEKLMVLSEGNARSLRGLCSCDNRRIYGTKESAIANLYTSKLQLMSQAYSQYLAGMTSSWQVLRELRRCPKFLTFIQMRNNENPELNIETFLQQPFKHLQEMNAEFRFLAENSSGSVEDCMAFETVASTLLGLLQTPSAMNEVELNLISALNNPDDEEGYKRGNKDVRPRTKSFV